MLLLSRPVLALYEKQSSKFLVVPTGVKGTANLILEVLKKLTV